MTQFTQPAMGSLIPLTCTCNREGKHKGLRFDQTILINVVLQSLKIKLLLKAKKNTKTTQQSTNIYEYKFIMQGQLSLRKNKMHASKLLN